MGVCEQSVTPEFCEAQLPAYEISVIKHHVAVTVKISVGGYDGENSGGLRYCDPNDCIPIRVETLRLLLGLGFNNAKPTVVLEYGPFRLILGLFRLYRTHIMVIGVVLQYDFGFFPS